MGEQPITSEIFSKFNGMVTSVDPHDVPSTHAILQINATAVRPGELNIRKGLTELTFEDEGD